MYFAALKWLNLDLIVGTHEVAGEGLGFIVHAVSTHINSDTQPLQLAASEDLDLECVMLKTSHYYLMPIGVGGLPLI